MAIFQRRQIRPEDIEHIAPHLKILEGHYGQVQNSERGILLQNLLRDKAISGLMLERLASSGDRKGTPVALGITGFLTLDTAHALIATPPQKSIVELVYQREQNGTQLLLRPNDVAIENSGKGLALIFLHFYLPAGDPLSPDTQQALELMQSSFRLHHGGYNCQLALHPGYSESPEGKESMLGMGFQPVGDGEHLLKFDLQALDQVPFHPFTCLRQKRAPVLHFSPAEKELLLLALWGNDDAFIAERQGISPDTVRKRWRSIFQKIEEQKEVNFFPNPEASKIEKTRGPEKRKFVLQFIDAHLEEVRPFSS